MKKILLSVGIIGIVGLIGYSATGAFFSDTETSTGNTFTAGSIDLKVDSTAHYAGLECVNDDGEYTWQLEPGNATTTRPDLIGDECSGSWTETDLGPNNQFFNISDVKPGDQGENTISLHVVDNNAWACMDIRTTSNAENTVINPEIKAGDSAILTGPLDGELAQNIQLFAWRDNASTSGAVIGDNIYQVGEPILFAPTSGFSLLSATTTLPLADSVTNGGLPLTGGVTGYVGVAWCAGTMSVSSTTGAVTCNGASMGNTAQTDSMTADVTLRVEQSRNNANFTCGSTTPVVDDGEVNQADLATTSAAALANPTKWFFYNDTNDTVMSIDQFAGTSGQNHMELVAGEEGAKMVLGTESDPRYNIATAQFGGTLLNTISPLNFRVYDATVDGDTPFLQFNVDFATSTVGVGYQGRLTMQPGAGGNAALPAATWTTVDALNGGNAMWTWSRYNRGPDLVLATADDNSWPDGNTNQYRTWNDIITSIPTAKLLTPGTFFGVRTGQPGPAGATNFVSSINFDGTVYNFEI